MKYINKKNKIFIAGHRGMLRSAFTRNQKNKKYLNLLTALKIELDLTDSNKVNTSYKDNKPDFVIIAAAKVGGILENSSCPTQFLLDNLKIQNNHIEGARKNNLTRLLFIGSGYTFIQNLQNNQLKLKKSLSLLTL